MTTLDTTRSKGVKKAFLAGLAFMVLLTPTYAFSAERDGTVLFFSFEDLKKALTSPSLSQWRPSFSWGRSEGRGCSGESH